VVDNERRGWRKEIDRRQFLKGMGAGAVTLSFAGCGVNYAKKRQAGQDPSKVKGEFSWTREKGKTLNLIFAKHPMADSYIAELPSFEKLTGIKVTYDTLPEEEFFQKVRTDLSSGKGIYDAFMAGPPNNWQYAAAGWNEPLDAYINNPAVTDKGYNVEDFYPAAIDVNTWDPNGSGKGSLWAIPANEEGYSLFYRKDILEQAGMAVPQTFDEVIASAKKLHGQTFSGKKITGFVGRGDKTFPTMTGGFSSAFGAYGGKDVTSDGKVLINSPQTVNAVTKWADLQQYSPPNVGTFTWYEAMNHFAAGNSAFFIDADHMSETFEDPASSSVVGKVGYSLPPQGDHGRACGIWIWSLAMSASSQNNIAAWLFLQWATSKEQLQKAITKGNINPTRQSLSNSNTMKEYTKDWGNYNQAWQTILSKYAKWRYIKSPKFPELGDRWALAVQEVVLGKKSAQQALDEAANDTKSILA
jgi:multiple sugar transport system substrate-binding protein